MTSNVKIFINFARLLRTANKTAKETKAKNENIFKRKASWQMNIAKSIKLKENRDNNIIILINLTSDCLSLRKVKEIQAIIGTKYKNAENFIKNDKAKHNAKPILGSGLVKLLL